jgi:RHS repeat-associated protein
MNQCIRLVALFVVSSLILSATAIGASLSLEQGQWQIRDLKGGSGDVATVDADKISRYIDRVAPNEASVLGSGGAHSDAPAMERFAHVRHRVLDSTLGRWTRRDPAGYVDGGSLLRYSLANPVVWSDATGLVPHACGDPWPNALPPCKYGRQGRDDSICDQGCTSICNRNPDVDGVTLCIGKRAVPCTCNRNIQAWFSQFDRSRAPDCFEEQYIKCTLHHEARHVLDIDCSCNPDNEITNDLPWRDAACGGVCSECSAYGDTLACLTQIDCNGRNCKCPAKHARRLHSMSRVQSPSASAVAATTLILSAQYV